MRNMFTLMLAAIALGFASCAEVPVNLDPSAQPGTDADPDFKGRMPDPEKPKPGHPLGVSVDPSTYTAVTERSNGRDVHPCVFQNARTTEVYFASDLDGRSFDIYRKTPHGSRMTKITSLPGNELWPSVDPKGNYLAFCSNSKGNWDVYVMALKDDWLAPVLITPGSSEHDIQPTWSPDGSTLVYASYSPTVGEYILKSVEVSRNMEDSTMRAADTGKSLLAYGDLPDAGDQMMRVGSKDASTKSGFLSVSMPSLLMSSQGSVVTGRAPHFRPSSNGEMMIAYQDFRGSGHRRSSVKLFDLKKRSISILSGENTYGAIQPRWSPSGKHIVFTAVGKTLKGENAMNRGGDSFVIVDMNGTMQMIPNPTDRPLVSSPFWFNRHDENHLYFTAYDNMSENVVSVMLSKAR